MSRSEKIKRSVRFIFKKTIAQNDAQRRREREKIQKDVDKLRETIQSLTKRCVGPEMRCLIELRSFFSSVWYPWARYSNIFKKITKWWLERCNTTPTTTSERWWSYVKKNCKSIERLRANRCFLRTWWKCIWTSSEPCISVCLLQCNRSNSGTPSSGHDGLRWSNRRHEKPNYIYEEKDQWQWESECHASSRYYSQNKIKTVALSFSFSHVVFVCVWVDQPVLYVSVEFE